MTVRKKLELTWIGKEQELELEPRVLVEDKKLSNFANDKNTENMLIHGDNLLALKALESDFAGKIKCIYIDPPYNTGAAFEHYDDNLEHSTWLNLMKPRLELLKKLLREDGAIFIQIDDNEGAYLKVMCDEIFGRDNFISSIALKMSTASGVKTSHREKTIIKEKETILVYAKNNEHFRVKPQYVPVREWDDEFQYYLEKNNSNNSDDWKVLRLTDVLKNNNLPENINNEKTYRFIIANKDKIWRRAFIRNEYKTKSQENPDKIFYVKNDETEHYYYRGREMFFLESKFHECLTEEGYKEELSNLLGDFWVDINTGKLFNEGGIEFRNSKKPEFLIARIIDMCSNEGDWVLDSFLGSGTTCAVAHKMKRKWIGIELGEHAYSLAKVRIDNVVEGKDQSGMSKPFGWVRGGGYHFYELAPTLIKEDAFGQKIINPEYNPEMLAATIAKHEGYKYEPDKVCFWKQANNGLNSYLYVTTNHVNKEIIESIKTELKTDEYLLISCKSFDDNATDGEKNIEIKKIPQSVLKDCEYGINNYDLNIINQAFEQSEDGEDNV